MNPRTRNTLVRVGCAILVFGALLALTKAALRVESREHASRQEQQFQETIRLALWRMDSALSLMLAQESTQSIADSEIDQGSTSAASPTPSLIRQRFLFAADGAGVKGQETSFDNDFARHWGANDRFHASAVPGRETPIVEKPQAPFTSEYQKRANLAVLSQRQEAQTSGIDLSVTPPIKPLTTDMRLVPAKEAVLTVFRPLWAKSADLYLLRNVMVAERRYIQGIELDWPAVRSWLLEQIDDLLPSADLIPGDDSSATPTANQLATIPAALVPGSATTGERPGWTPLRVFLVAAWIAVIAAFAAFGYALRTTTELGERRGRFVSAVTHELRTPLTTFQLYSQMLADDMVRDEKTRREYLKTLKRESERLGSIVENVLLYARVEGNRAALHGERIETEELLRRVAARLERRAADDGMQLEIDVTQAGGSAVYLDPQAVDQILFNLVDNSCKYAALAADRRLHLSVRRRGNRIEILYSDHGPGIPAQESARLFLPFERGAKELAGGTPGIGLGLTLARAMAQDLGGDLSLDSANRSGATFCLSFPAVA